MTRNQIIDCALKSGLDFINPDMEELYIKLDPFVQMIEKIIREEIENTIVNKNE